MMDMRLKAFVEGPLQECIKEAASDVASLEYVEDMKDERPFVQTHWEQAVIVTFGNGYQKIANVHLDSPWGCIKDVMRCIER